MIGAEKWNYLWIELTNQTINRLRQTKIGTPQSL